MLLSGCQSNAYLLEPNFTYVPQAKHFESLPTPFPPLTEKEAETAWGNEYQIATVFAREFDFYRAITAYKRALILLPKEASERRLEIHYHTLLAYYLGGKYQEAVEIFEGSELSQVSSSFPAFGDLLLLLYDAYSQDCRSERAAMILQLIEKCSPETGEEIRLSEAIVEGRIAEAQIRLEDFPAPPATTPWLDLYCCEAKSVRAAQWANALLPGAGYLYVGQATTALTALVLNGLFSAATYQFFHRDYIAAGLITLFFEAGWYFGGINGAGLAAKEYNQRLYETYGKELMIERRLFPVMMFEFSF